MFLTLTLAQRALVRCLDFVSGKLPNVFFFSTPSLLFEGHARHPVHTFRAVVRLPFTITRAGQVERSQQSEEKVLQHSCTPLRHTHEAPSQHDVHVVTL